MGPVHEDPRILITDIDGTVNKYGRRKAAIWKAVIGSDYKGDIEALDVQEALRDHPQLFDIFERLFFSDDPAYTTLDDPLPGAAETLAYFHLSRGLWIAYLTARIVGDEGSMVLETASWLGKNRFPDPANSRGAYLFMRQKRDQDPLQYKKGDIEAIKRIARPVAGVGDKPIDATAYLESGIPAFSFRHPRYKDTQYPSGTIFVANWGDVRREVERLF